MRILWEIFQYCIQKNKGCTKQRAVALNCNVSGATSNNRLVKRTSLSKTGPINTYSINRYNDGYSNITVYVTAYGETTINASEGRPFKEKSHITVSFTAGTAVISEWGVCNPDGTNFHIYFSGDDEQIDGFVSNEEDVSAYTLVANVTTIPSTNENSSSALNSTHNAELNNSMYLKDMWEMFNYKDHITQLVMTYLQYQNNYAFDISDYDITYNYNVIQEFFEAGFDANKVKKKTCIVLNK